MQPARHNSIVEPLVQELQLYKRYLKMGILEDLGNELPSCQVFFYLTGSGTINQVSVLDDFLGQSSELIASRINFLL